VINRLSQTLKTPFKLEGVTRVDDTPVEIAVVLDISPARARVYLKELVESGKLKSTGANKGKIYYLPE
jgi:Fic family protein